MKSLRTETRDLQAKGAYRSRTGVALVTKDPTRSACTQVGSALRYASKGYAARNVLERAIAKRDGGWDCFYCGNPCANTIDHVVPRYRGGSDGIDNLVFACWWCNDEKNTQPGWSFALRKAGTPREEWRDSAGRPLPPLNLGLAGNSVGIPSEAPDHELGAR